MAHPAIDNQTPFVLEPLFVADEAGRPIVAPIVRATFDVAVTGEVTLAEEQLPVNFAGESYGEPGASSYRYEPEIAFVKPATDVVLVGHAYADGSGSGYVDVEFRVGPVGKWIRVHGDRRVMPDGAISAPDPFDLMPLTYERAFGGWDRTAENPEQHSCEPWNPVGVGFKAPHGIVYQGDPLPNLEDPHDPLTVAGGWCRPTGFGFVSPHWQPRAAYAGTYDESWTETRAPLLPADFDRRYFSAASDGLVAPGYLVGNEAVAIRQATPEGFLGFHLPGVANPECRIATRLGEDRVLGTNLDTVIFDADARRLTLLWRCYTELRDGPLDVRAIVVRCDNMSRPVGAAAEAFAEPIDG